MSDAPRIDELRRRVEADPASFAFAALAEEYRKAGRFDEAIAACRSGLEKHPSYVSARATLGRALVEVGDLAGAREELAQVLQAAPQHLGALRGLAEASRRVGDLADAIAKLRLASQLAPQDRDLSEQLLALEAALAPTSAAAGPLATAGDETACSGTDGLDLVPSRDPKRVRQLAALDRVLASVHARRPETRAAQADAGSHD
jgi:tetratricopeptide (TPR) repeat protein